MNRIVYDTPEGIAVVEDGLLVEFLSCPTSSPDATSPPCPASPSASASLSSPTPTPFTQGDICLGKVERIMKGLDCAFVDIGRRRAGFLPLKENSQTFTGSPLRAGDQILVQIRREETGEKGVFLSRDLSLAGALVILMPMNRFVGVSKRVADPQIIRDLKALGGEITENRFGLVLREAAAEALRQQEEESRMPAEGHSKETVKDAIRRETESLLQEWEEMLAEAGFSGLLSASSADTVTCKGDFHPRVLRASSPLSSLAKDWGLRGGYTLEHVDCLPEFLKAQLRAAASRKVQLPGGCNLIIDRCEALTVIDVNSAGHNADGKRQTFLETNRAACAEIVRQTRLRNLGGIILIDFIDMDLEEDRTEVEETLRQAFRADRRKTVLHGWTRLGLMEMTRKRE